MLSTPKSKGELFLASSLRDGLEDNDLSQVKTLLLNNEADPNVLFPIHGISPFHLVIGNESENFAEEVTKLFLRHGGNPNVKSIDGMTPVHVAAAWGRIGILELLLANGGDPLCLDDDKRSPFHYAFDGGFYKAVAVLASYSGTSQDEDVEEEPKYKIRLDKILVNRGDCVAEYVPSDVSCSISLKSEIKETLKSPKNELSLENAENSSDSSTSSSTLDDEFSHLITNNVTHRRRVNRRDNSKTESNLNIAFEECSAEDERLLIGQIITRLSTSIEKDSATIINKVTTTSLSRNADNKALLSKKTRSFLPPPKSNSRNVKKIVENSHLQLADTSIISKSPNIRILSSEKTPNIRILGSKKTPDTKKKLFFTTKSKFHTTPKKIPENRIKSASSTPKRKQSYSRICGSVRVTKNEKSNNQKKSNVDNEIFDKTYCKNTFGEIPYSTDTERKGRNVDRRLFTINIDDKSEKNKSKNTELCNIENSEENKLSTKGKIVKIEAKVDKNSYFCRGKENETLTGFFESPGSSIPISVSRLEYTNSIKKKLEGYLEDEDAEIWLEIEDAFKNRCGSPPASISLLEDDDAKDLTQIYDNEIANPLSFYSDYGSETNSELDEAFVDDKAANNGFIDSRSCSESFFSVDEEYLYEDAEEGVAFTERHLCVTPASYEDDKNRVMSRVSWIDRFEELSLLTSDNSPVTSPQRGFLFSLDDKTLRDRLTALGDYPGPITKTTFSVYLKRLYRLEGAQKSLPKERKSPPKSTEKIVQRSRISDSLLSIDWPTKLQYYRNLEEEAFKEYSSTNPSRKYRGGISKNSFCYLLLDPRVTRDLPRSGIHLSIEARWTRFLEGIFYVGKGKGARPIAHLYDAFAAWTNRKNAGISSHKIRKILDIWQNDKGVVCLHVFLHTMVEEACSREAAIIDALETTNLTNCVRGTYYGYTTTMNAQEKQSLGKYLLYKALEIFMHEGERQLFPRNVIM